MKRTPPKRRIWKGRSNYYAPDLSRHFYPSQKKIWEGGTKDEMRIFEALFKGVSTQFGPRTIEKGFEKSAFHLLFGLPKSSFGVHNFATFCILN
jgi:hypothetical protein